MKRFQPHLSLLCAALCFAGPAFSQSSINIQQPSGGLGWFTRPYRVSTVSPINLGNSNRLETLIQGGKLYLSSQDVVALALENNLDIEIQRYGPSLAKENLRRAQSGAALRSVGAAVAAGPVSVSTTGVSSTLSSSNGGNTAAGNGGGIATGPGSGAAATAARG